VNQTLIQEILEVVEQAAIASAKLTGLGQKDEADAAAVEAMRLRMGKIEMKGKIVIGEGERDEAPMLYIGEEVGSGSGPGVDFAVDPCEGTNLSANNQRGSMAVLAASDTGGLFNAPDFYMNKLAAPPAVARASWTCSTRSSSSSCSSRHASIRSSSSSCSSSSSASMARPQAERQRTISGNTRLIKAALHFL